MGIRGYQGVLPVNVEDIAVRDHLATHHKFLQDVERRLSTQQSTTETTGGGFVQSISEDSGIKLLGDVNFNSGAGISLSRSGQDISVAVSPSGIDHGGLAGLADSADHSWATLIDGTRAFTGNQAMGTNKLTGLAAATASGDAIAHSLNPLNHLATATGNYSMGFNNLTEVSTINTDVVTATTSVTAGELQIDSGGQLTTSGGAFTIAELRSIASESTADLEITSDIADGTSPPFIFDWKSTGFSIPNDFTIQAKMASFGFTNAAAAFVPLVRLYARYGRTGSGFRGPALIVTHTGTDDPFIGFVESGDEADFTGMHFIGSGITFFTNGTQRMETITGGLSIGSGSTAILENEGNQDMIIRPRGNNAANRELLSINPRSARTTAAATQKLLQVSSNDTTDGVTPQFNVWNHLDKGAGIPIDQKFSFDDSGNTRGNTYLLYDSGNSTLDCFVDAAEVWNATTSTLTVLENIVHASSTETVSAETFRGDFDSSNTMTVDTDITFQRFYRFQQPNVSINATKSIIVGATVYIEDAPVDAGAGTLVATYALWVDGGQCRFDGNILMAQDSVKTIYGAGLDATVYFDATNLIIDPDEVGSGIVLIGATGDDDMRLNDIEVDGDLNHDGSNVGFYATTPAAQPAHIVDADGTLADITTKFNTLLAQMATLGLQASA